jgi:hypothetical protein
LNDMNAETERQVEEVLEGAASSGNDRKWAWMSGESDVAVSGQDNGDDVMDSTPMDEDEDEVYIEREETLVINPGVEQLSVTPASVVKRGSAFANGPSDTPVKTPTTIVPRFAVPALPGHKTPKMQEDDPRLACKNSWGSVVGSNILQAAATPGNDAGLAANAKSCLEEDGSLHMFWLDAYEANGVVYLFGKVLNRDQDKFVSCCIAIQNSIRNVFVLPRPFKIDGISRV